MTNNNNLGYESRSDFQFTRILNETIGKAKYRRRKDEVKTVCHWGQRKLLFSEIEFLTNLGRRGDTIVYAGAAPGTHIRYLVDLFPGFKFVLVDPAPFTVKEDQCIEIRQQLFTDEMCEEFNSDKYQEYDEKTDHYHSKVLFISDIRSADPQVLSNEQVEKCVAEDMSSEEMGKINSSSW